jgi:para-aminobenzoate synthetase/4-amino-4-deoxychorismate lyase
MPDSPTVLFDSFTNGGYASSWRFSDYVKTVTAMHPEEVIGVLNQVEQAADEGLYAVGFVAFEAASALNPDLFSLPPREGLPLAWFALFREQHSVAAGSELRLSTEQVTFAVQKSGNGYRGDIDRIRDYIAAGDCYQVNHTFSMEGTFSGNPRELYARISAAQKAPFSAYLETGRFTILSASPELFFALKDGTITTRPMKGTARRGRWTQEDRTAIIQLRESPKEKAENLMIVDLLRNDLGVIAATGSVQVDTLFDVETYPTVHQMTSTVSAKVRPGVSLTDIFQALFPCGSVTGAPKRRCMEIISELEQTPRGVYCGAIGYVAPGGEATFSVAIRTLLLDMLTNSLALGVGSGVTWDSKAAAEYAECLGKAVFVNHSHRQTSGVLKTSEVSSLKPALLDFSLIESMRLENGVYTLLERHIRRLADSAEYFGFACNQEKVRHSLFDHAEHTDGLRKVRLLLAEDGGITISSELLSDSTAPLRIAISSIIVDSSDCLRYHKTTRRELLDAARSEHPDCDEVLLLNERGELTEGSYHNLVAKIDGHFVTPPLECGLLSGVLREDLLEEGEISERIISVEDLQQAEEIWLINSVRGWRRGVIIELVPSP